MKFYLAFTFQEVVDPYGHVATRNRGAVFETDKPLTDTSRVLEILRNNGWTAFVGPVLPAEIFTEFPEELLRGAVIFGEEIDTRFWVIPVGGDPEPEMPEVQDE